MVGDLCMTAGVLSDRDAVVSTLGGTVATVKTSSARVLADWKADLPTCHCGGTTSLNVSDLAVCKANTEEVGEPTPSVIVGPELMRTPVLRAVVVAVTPGFDKLHDGNLLTSEGHHGVTCPCLLAAPNGEHVNPGPRTMIVPLTKDLLECKRAEERVVPLPSTHLSRKAVSLLIGLVGVVPEREEVLNAVDGEGSHDRRWRVHGNGIPQKSPPGSRERDDNIVLAREGKHLICIR